MGACVHACVCVCIEYYLLVLMSTSVRLQALDHKTNTYVAIKIIRNKKRFHHQALVEVKILDSLRRKDESGHYNIIHMIEYFYFRNHLCIVFELMG